MRFKHAVLAVALLFASAVHAQNVTKPVITLSAPAADGTVVATITDATPGAVIYYTTNGTTPNTLSPKYTKPFTVHASATLKAFATLNPSTLAILGVKITPPPPPTTYPYTLTTSIGVLSYNWVVGSAAPVAQAEQIGDTSPCPPVPPVLVCHWAVSVSVNQPWIVATPASGTTSFALTVTLDPTKLPTVPGDYPGKIILTVPQFTNPTVVIPVTVRITAPTTAHNVTLGWTAPVSSPVAVTGFNVYRGTASGVEPTKLNPSPLTTTSAIDAPGTGTFYYVVKSVAADGTESIPSNEAQAIVP